MTVSDRCRWADRHASRPARPPQDASAPTVHTIGELALQKAAATPERIALWFDGDEAVTYAQVADEAGRLAAGLQRLGLVPGDVVSLQLPNWREAAIVNVAASLLGLVVNPIPTIYRGAELKDILEDARPRLIFVPATFRAVDHPALVLALRDALPERPDIVVVRGPAPGATRYEEVLRLGAAARLERPQVDPDAVKLVLYTSGTTGRAKGVLHTHRAMQVWPTLSVREWGLAAGDVMFMPSPVTHITGYAFGIEMPFFSDVQVALTDHWNPDEAVATIGRLGVSAFVGATPFLKELLEAAARANDRLPSMRVFACGGASVPPDLIRRVGEVTTQCRSFRVFGATEVPLVTQGFAHAGETEAASTTDGRVMGYEVRIVDPASGTELPRGESGEIRARGAAMMLDYTRDEDSRRAFDADGYFQTGDLGYLTKDDGLVVTGRLKDLIIRGGENLSPKEIEDALGRHPAIREAAVVAMPHPRLGEGVCAFLIVREGATAPDVPELARFLGAAGLARQKVPERVECVADFPRTPAGKVRKDRLRALARESGARPA